MEADQDKIEALAAFTGDAIEDIEIMYEDVYNAGGGEYLVLTDEEADRRAKEYILDSLWAFNACFIADHTKQGYSTALEESIKQVQGKMCEGANNMVLALIDDIDEFIDDAISADGRGHFLAGYDGEENEQDSFFIYREN